MPTTDENRVRVTVIGLGSIGRGLAGRLARAPEVALTVFNRSEARYEGLDLDNVSIAPDMKTAVADAEIVILSLTDDRVVRCVVADVGACLKPATIVVDTSTISADSARALASELALRSVGFVDSPVTGGAEGAAAGTLTFLCGGSEEHLDRVRPVLEHCAQEIHHLGDVGQGQMAKAVNQVMLAGTLMGVAEGIALAKRARLEVEPLVAALMNGAAASWVLRERAVLMANNDFEPRGRIALHHKDLGIALRLADELSLELPLTRLVEATEASLVAQGGGDADVTAIIQAIR